METKRPRALWQRQHSRLLAGWAGTVPPVRMRVRGELQQNDRDRGDAGTQKTSQARLYKPIYLPSKPAIEQDFLA